MKGMDAERNPAEKALYIDDANYLLKELPGYTAEVAALSAT